MSMDRPQPVATDFDDVRPVAADVRAAWEAAGSPSWALGTLPLLPDAAAFENVLMGPRASVARWHARAERLGLSPTISRQHAA
jgi:hypothetical protein